MTETAPRRHFIVIIAIFGIISIGNGKVERAAARWTEQDEARRIQQLMEAEELEYEMEQRSQSAVGGDGDGALRGSYHRYPATEFYRLKNTAAAPVKFTYPNVITTATSTSTAATITLDNNYWCYHCASPLSAVSGNMRRAIEKFLRIRRTAYPLHVKNARCTEPRNLTQLAVERCRHPHCQTLILTDHDTGSAFTIRGCAETFGAINEELLDARGDNTCQRLHEHLDIQECICRNRRYCYPGAERRLYSISTAGTAAGAMVVTASASAITAIFIFYFILLICLGLL